MEIPSRPQRPPAGILVHVPRADARDVPSARVATPWFDRAHSAEVLARLVLGRKAVVRLQVHVLPRHAVVAEGSRGVFVFPPRRARIARRPPAWRGRPAHAAPRPRRVGGGRAFATIWRLRAWRPARQLTRSAAGGFGNTGAVLHRVPRFAQRSGWGFARPDGTRGIRP